MTVQLRAHSTIIKNKKRSEFRLSEVHVRAIQSTCVTSPAKSLIYLIVLLHNNMNMLSYVCLMLAKPKKVFIFSLVCNTKNITKIKKYIYIYIYIYLFQNKRKGRKFTNSDL